MTKISEHISLAEATKSQAAIRAKIDNTPDAKQMAAMKNVAEKCFEPLRKFHGKPIAVTSFFRNAAVNKLIGGSATSQHMTGEAMDIDADVFNNGITNKQVFEWLKKNVEFDQLISEYGTVDKPDWIHVSYRLDGKNRKQVLRIG